jgi:hypothetical protein
MDWCNNFGYSFRCNDWLGILMSKHEQIILNFIEKNPHWKRFQFRKELNKIFIDDPFETLNYIPDGFYIDISKNTVNLLEVDGTSGTTTAKLNKMIDLWWQIDGRSWFLTLTSISVYTEAKSFIDDNGFWDLAEQQMQQFVKQERKQYGNVNA